MGTTECVCHEKCPECGVGIEVAVECEVSASLISIARRGGDDEHDKNAPMEPYQPLLPSLSTISEFTVVGKFGDKEFYSTGFIAFLRRPPFVHRLEPMDAANLDHDYRPGMEKENLAKPVPARVTVANNARAVLEDDEGRTWQVMRAYVDVFRAMHPECRFERFQQKGVFYVRDGEELVGMFTAFRPGESS